MFTGSGGRGLTWGALLLGHPKPYPPLLEAKCPPPPGEGPALPSTPHQGRWPGLPPTPTHFACSPGRRDFERKSVLPLEPGKWKRDPFATGVAEHLGEMGSVGTGAASFLMLPVP